jgi:hypothetical protein
LEIHREGVYASSGQSHHEVRPVEPRGLGGHLLRELIALVPVDGRGQSELSTELLRGATERREDRGGQVEGKYRHRRAPSRKQGTPLPINDIWLAAQAMEAHATLLSADRHFAKIDGLSWLSFSFG